MFVITKDTIKFSIY